MAPGYFNKDYGYSSVDPYIPPKKKVNTLYTIFVKHKDESAWVFVTTGATGNNCRDAVERWYGSNPLSVVKAIAFPTNSGQEVIPPRTNQWTSRNL